MKLQFAGLPIGATRFEVRGDVDQGKFAVAHLDDEGRLRAVEAVNFPKEYMAGRAAIGNQHSA